MNVDVILGLQWGDEGKGKIVDYLAPKYDIICRFQGGPNAGHTLNLFGKTIVLHTIPSGIFRPEQINVIGGGVVIDPVTLLKELEVLESFGIDYQNRLLVSKKAHLILPTHRLLDKASEVSKGVAKIGSTLRGIGPTYMDKTGRNGLRAGDLFNENFDKKYKTLKEKHLGILQMYPEMEVDPEEDEKEWFDSLDILRNLHSIDSEYYLNQALDSGKKILAEGAQGSMLDIDFGTYPYVTSSNTISAGVCTGLGISPKKIGEVIGITKAYCTRVGAGPFPTELTDSQGEKLRNKGQEFGATTGRPRRCGWLDIPQLKYTIMINGVTQLAITKIDVLDHFDTFKAGYAYQSDNGETTRLPFDLCSSSLSPKWITFPGWNCDLAQFRKYSELPAETHNYVEFLEKKLELQVRMISTGPGRESLILKQG